MDQHNCNRQGLVIIYEIKFVGRHEAVMVMVELLLHIVEPLERINEREAASTRIAPNCWLWYSSGFGKIDILLTLLKTWRESAEAKFLMKREKPCSETQPGSFRNTNATRAISVRSQCRRQHWCSDILQNKHYCAHPGYNNLRYY